MQGKYHHFLNNIICADKVFFNVLKYNFKNKIKQNLKRNQDLIFLYKTKHWPLYCLKLLLSIMQKKKGMKNGLLKRLFRENV